MPYNIAVRAYRQWIPEDARKRYQKIVEEILGSSSLSESKYVSLTERKLERITGKRHAILVNSGGSAFELIMSYYWHKGKRKAYLQALGFHGVYSILKRIGYKIVFVDTEEDRFVIDVKKLPNNLGNDSVVVVTDLSGYHYPDVDEKLQNTGVTIVYDAAHALGVIDTEFDYFVSFHGGKIVGCGEGGAILTDDDGLAEYARLAKVYGMVGRRPVLRGYSYCMTELCAGLLYVLLDYLDENIRVNRMIVEKYAMEIPEMYENVLRERGYPYRHNGFQAVMLTNGLVETEALRMILYEEYGVQEWGTAARYIPYEPIVDDSEAAYLENAYRQATSHILLPTGVDNKANIEYVIGAVKAAKSMLESKHKYDKRFWREWIRGLIG